MATSNKSALVRRYDLALMFLLMLGAVLLIGYTAKKVLAAEFAEPPGGPSEGNIPVTIWNRDATVIGNEGGIWPQKQQDTSINIDGQIYVGDSLMNLSGTGNAQHLIYGSAHYLNGPPPSYTYYMDADDYFIWLDASYTNYPAAGQNNIYRRFSVDRGGSMYAAGSIQGSGSFIAGSTGHQMTMNNLSSYLFYGVSRYDEGTPAQTYADADLDYLLWLRSYDYTGTPDLGYTERFTIDVTGDVWAKGRVKSEGCFGPTFVGLTVTGGQNSLGSYRPSDVAGYYGANNRCAADYTGAHVCTANELLESIRCSAATHPIRLVPSGTRAWVNAGPPGHTSNYSDCEGWISSAATSYARYWIFDTVTGGRGTGVSCNTINGIQFACCK
ncbi:MAG: hypothetical protein V1738_01085 [Patescibacteria group bacterium]